MFGKIHTELFDSSLMAEGGWLPSYVFMCMVTLSDKEGYLRHDPRTLYRRIGLAEDGRVSFGEFQDAIEYLCQADSFSNISDHEGRRIIPLKELEEHGNRGWWIVNKAHYRDLGGDLEARRKADRERKRKQRERENNNLEAITPECHVTVTPQSRESAHTDTDTDTDTVPSAKRAFGSDDLIELFNRSCPDLPKIKKWNDQRRRALSARIREDAKRRELDWWEIYFQYAHTLDKINGRERFGRNNDFWFADIDYLLTPNGMTRVLEGRW